MASAAPISWGEALRPPLPLGSSITTSPSQNAIRKRKNMNPTSLAARTTVAGDKIAASLESRVREVGSFLFIVGQNTPQIFDNLKRSSKK
jgi:hypothetical protein